MMNLPTIGQLIALIVFTITVAVVALVGYAVFASIRRIIPHKPK